MTVKIVFNEPKEQANVIISIDAGFEVLADIMIIELWDFDQIDDAIAKVKTRMSENVEDQYIGSEVYMCIITQDKLFVYDFHPPAEYVFSVTDFLDVLIQWRDFRLAQRAAGNMM